MRIHQAPGAQQQHALNSRRVPLHNGAVLLSGGRAGKVTIATRVAQATVVKTTAQDAPDAATVEAVAAAVAPPEVQAPALQSHTSERGDWQTASLGTKDEGAAAADTHVVLPSGPRPKRADTLHSIVFVSSECGPWSKTGGLGDVMSALPKALAARGHRVMVVIPRYANYEEAIDTGKQHTVLGTQIRYFHHVGNGVDYVFVDHPSFPRPGGLYSDQFGEYGDNQFRYTLLTLAALEAPLVLPLGEQGLYGQKVTFMANDWHTALVPVYLAAKYRPFGVYKEARSMLAIHNLKHQGVYPPGSFASLDLPSDWYKALEWQYPPHQRQGAYEEEGRSVNHMKAGIITADRLVTVSPGYADEIKTWLGGWGMDGLLGNRGYVLNGITNGIDTDTWNPATDKHIAKQYTIDTFLEGKAACKKAMQVELSLPQVPDLPLVVFIGRLDNQKGADILLNAVQQMLPNGRFQLVCLGTGDKTLESSMKWLEDSYRDKVRCWVGFNEPLSHRLTAAADIVVMPSRFEPCGLNQLYAMRYGAVPVAHKTGGLKDTVVDYDPWNKDESKRGTGWTYTSCDASGLVWALGTALHTYYNFRPEFEGLQRRGMQRDSGWDLAAQQYEQCLNWASFDEPFCK